MVPPSNICVILLFLIARDLFSVVALDPEQIRDWAKLEEDGYLTVYRRMSEDEAKLVGKGIGNWKHRQADEKGEVWTSLSLDHARHFFNLGDLDDEGNTKGQVVMAFKVDPEKFIQEFVEDNLIPQRGSSKINKKDTPLEDLKNLHHKELIGEHKHGKVNIAFKGNLNLKKFHSMVKDSKKYKITEDGVQHKLKIGKDGQVKWIVADKYKVLDDDDNTVRSATSKANGDAESLLKQVQQQPSSSSQDRTNTGDGGQHSGPQSTTPHPSFKLKDNEFSSPQGGPARDLVEKHRTAVEMGVRKPMGELEKLNKRGRGKTLKAVHKLFEVASNLPIVLGDVLSIISIFLPSSPTQPHPALMEEFEDIKRDLRNIQQNLAEIKDTLFAQTTMLQQILDRQAWIPISTILLEVENDVNTQHTRYLEILQIIKRERKQKLKDFSPGPRNGVVNFIKGDARQISEHLEQLKSLIFGKSKVAPEPLFSVYKHINNGDQHCTQLAEFGKAMYSLLFKATEIHIFLKACDRGDCSTGESTDREHWLKVHEVANMVELQFASCLRNSPENAGKAIEEILIEEDKRGQHYSASKVKQELDTRFPSYRWAVIIGAASWVPKSCPNGPKQCKEHWDNKKLGFVNNDNFEVSFSWVPVFRDKTSPLRLNNFNQRLYNSAVEHVCTYTDVDSAGFDVEQVDFCELSGSGKLGSGSSYYLVRNDYPKDDDYKCVNGETIHYTKEEAISTRRCLCNFGYVGHQCDVQTPHINDAKINTLFEATDFSVPGLFDIQDDIKNQTSQIVTKIDKQTRQLGAKIDASTQKLWDQIDTRAESIKNEVGAKIDDQTKQIKKIVDEQTAQLENVIDDQTKQLEQSISSNREAIILTGVATLNKLNETNAIIFKQFDEVKTYFGELISKQKLTIISQLSNFENMILDGFVSFSEEINSKVKQSMKHVLTNRFHEQLNRDLPSFLYEFKKAVSASEVARHEKFAQYVEREEHSLNKCRYALIEAITGTSTVGRGDSYIKIQMDDHKTCSEEYNRDIKRFRNDLFRLHYTIFLMRSWVLNHKLKSSANNAQTLRIQQDIVALNIEKEKDIESFTQSIRNGGCPDFRLEDDEGMKCPPLGTFVGQRVDLLCKHAESTTPVHKITKTLTNSITCQNECNNQNLCSGRWSTDPANIACIGSCMYQGSPTKIGMYRTLEDPGVGFEWTDTNGKAVTKVKCILNDYLEPHFHPYVTKTKVDECLTKDCGNGRCINTEHSYKCECHDGFEYSAQEMKCVDINECRNNGAGERNCLSHMSPKLGVCRNEKGSYKCECFPGKSYRIDQHHCREKGKIMAIGGRDENDNYLSTVEVTDPNNPASKCMKNNLPQRRAGHVMLGNVICGGYSSDSAETLSSCLKLRNGLWTKMADLLEPRLGAAAVKHANTWWIVGGDGSHRSSTSSDLWQKGTTTITKGVSLPEHMMGHCLASVNSTHILIGGAGDDHKGAYILDASSGIGDFTKRQRKRLNYQRDFAACGILSKYKGEYNVPIVIGGGSTFSSRRSSEIFSNKRNRWKRGPYFDWAFTGGAYLQFSGDLLLIGGGDKRGNQRQKIIKYNGETEKFEELDSQLLKPRDRFAAAILRDDESNC